MVIEHFKLQKLEALMIDTRESANSDSSDFMANIGLGRLHPKTLIPQEFTELQSDSLIQSLNKKERILEQSVPFSSPAGILFTKHASVSSSYKTQCLEEIELNCQARSDTKVHPPNRKQHQGKRFQPKILKAMNKSRTYNWPRRQFHQRFRTASFFNLNRRKILQLKPLIIDLEKTSAAEIETFKALRSFRIRVKGLSTENVQLFLNKNKKREQERNCAA
jgi:hypothetical protein